MASNSLDSFNFIRLHALGVRGGCPPVMQLQMDIIQRPGVDGTAFIGLGSKGSPFQAQTKVDVATFADAIDLGIAYQQMARDQAYRLWWCGADFDLAGTRYFVIGVEPPTVLACRSGAGGLVSNPQATVEAVWTLVPVEYTAP